MRTQLRGFEVSGATHAGLLLDRLISPVKGTEAEKTVQRECMAVALHIRPSAPYRAAFKRWQDVQAQQRAVTMPVTTIGPLAIGLGSASPYEVGLTLHHTYGVPYLPGSALKGLARRAALARGLTEKDEAFSILFGTQASAAHVIWWDGWMAPETDRPLQLDTITVHHKEYYGGGKAWPTDFDDPTPVAFLSVPVGVTFHVALGGPAQWAHVAARLLDYGLAHLGLGGKTNAGYGGFRVERQLSPQELAEAERQEDERLRLEREGEEAKKHAARAEQFGRQIAGMNMGKAEQDVRNLLPQLKALPRSVRDGLLGQLLDRLTSDPRTKSKKKLLKSVQDALEAE